MSRYFLTANTEEQQQLDGGGEKSMSAPVSSISSSRNSVVVNKEGASLLEVRRLVFLKNGQNSKGGGWKKTRSHNTKKMNYLPNHWRRRVALHWPPAVVRLRCSARSVVVYHPTVDETPWNRPGMDRRWKIRYFLVSIYYLLLVYTDSSQDKIRRVALSLSLTCCLTSVDRSPRIGPSPVNSVSLRMTHSTSSRRDNSSAFQCSVLFSSRFL